MSWVAVGATVVSAGAGIYGANQAADAQGKAAKQNAALQQQNMLLQMGLIEPQRALGYGAQSDLASLYGYSLPEYQSANQLMSASANGSPVNVKGGGGGGIDFSPPLSGGISAQSILDPAGLFSRGAPNFGGTINPMTGTVSVSGHSDRDAALTQYLRTGTWPAGVDPGPNNKTRDLIKKIDALRASGWKYDPNAAQGANPAGQPGQAGNMSRFFTSPDYQFRRDEGQRDIGNSFAARGGAASGNALRALSSFNSSLAAGEYGQYHNRLMAMAGMGQTANGQAANAGNNYTQGLQQSNQQQGDARASGVLGATNSVSNALNGGINSYMMGQYINGMTGLNQGYNTTTPSQYGPYAGGYQFPATGKQQQQQYDWRSVLGGG